MDPEALTSALVARFTTMLEEQARESNLREQRLEERIEARLLQLAEGNNRRTDQASIEPGQADSVTETPTDTPAARVEPSQNGSAAVASTVPRRLGASATPAPRLAEGASMREFATWKQKFHGYALLTGLRELTTETQTAALIALLDDHWTRTLQHGLDVDINTTDVDTIIDAMERHLRGQRNTILDRRDFYRRQQEDGERFDDYLIAVREIAQFCDFCTECFDSHMRDKIVMGVRDDSTVRALLSETDLTLQGAIAICRARENAAENSEALHAQDTSLQRISTYRRNQSLGARHHMPGRQSPSPCSTSATAETCPNCGRPAHTDWRTCPARTAICFWCGRPGHTQNVCRRRAAGAERTYVPQEQQQPPQQGSGASLIQTLHVNDILLNAASSRRTPRVRLLMAHSRGSGACLWTLDTGSEASCIGPAHAEELQIHMADLSPPTDALYAAGGYKLQCHGSFECTLTLGAVTATVNVSVVQGLNNPLLSWHDAMALGILPPEFPAQLRSVGQTESASAPSSESTSVNDRPISPPLGADRAASSPAQGTESGPDAAHANPRPLWPDPTADSVANDRRKPPSQQPTDDVTAARRAAPQTPPSSDVTGGCKITPIEEPTLAKVREAAKNDAEYVSLCDTVLHGFPPQRSDLAVALRPYWGVRDRLAVDDGLLVCGSRLIIPRRLRQETLQRLHDSHQGIDRTLRRARQSVYWAGIDRDVTATVQACSACHERLPSQQREPMLSDPPPERVFESVSTDFFQHAGRAYLVYADRLSGWPTVVDCAGDATAQTLVRHLRSMFAATGVPCVLRSDGGPQYTAHYTKEFLQRWGVTHRLSTPYYPQSNGHAEAAVKLVKRLIQKVTKSGNLDCDAFARGLLEIRNTPRADGRSPAEVLYGHPLRSAVPIHHRAFAPEWQRVAEDCDKRADALRDAARDRYNVTAKPLSGLHLGSHVSIQDQSTGLWDRRGIIMGVGKSRDYLVKLPSGRILWRNRRYLRPLRPLVPTRAQRADQRPAAVCPAPPPPPPSPPAARDRTPGQSPMAVTNTSPQPVGRAPPTSPPRPAPRRSRRRAGQPTRLEVDPRFRYYV